MDRSLMRKANLAATSFAALFVLSLSTVLPAQARTPAAQTLPIISLDTPLARDAETFEMDKTLDAACRKTGQDKSVCLCITHIMKYELTLSEYRAATRLYDDGGERGRLRDTLKAEGFVARDIVIAEQMAGSLAEDADFTQRCIRAKSYYKTNGR